MAEQIFKKVRTDECNTCGSDVRDVRELLRIASFLDLTSLNDNDTESAIKQLCERAIQYRVAAVCVYPRFVRFAKRTLGDHKVLVATVANFPAGDGELESVEKEIAEAIEGGADEIDVVLPYKRLKAGAEDYVRDFVTAVRKASSNTTLKIILETGELSDPLLIKRASLLCVESGVEFVKTSTGKCSISATIPAATSMLEAIKDSGAKVGLKVSGGIRTVDDAVPYIELAEGSLGKLGVHNFRIGASSLLADIETRLQRAQDSTEIKATSSADVY
jgi:deoxyribose-phosphate aldolase